MDCSLIVIQYGPASLTINLLKSLITHPDSEAINEVVIVDNGAGLTTESKKSILDLNPPFEIKIVVNSRTSYASGVNAGARKADGDIFIISNNDILWKKEWTIRPLLNRIHEKSNIGVVGPQLVNKDASWQRSSGKFPSLRSAVQSTLFADSIGRAIDAYKYQTSNQKLEHVDYVDGAFLVTSAEVFADVNGWDEQFEFYAEDADYCHRVQKIDKYVAKDPQARITHFGGETSSKQEAGRYSKKLAESTTKFVNKNYGSIHSHLYVLLMIVANAERYLLYLLLTIVTKSDGFLMRRRQAVARLRGYISVFTNIIFTNA